LHCISRSANRIHVVLCSENDASPSLHNWQYCRLGLLRVATILPYKVPSMNSRAVLCVLWSSTRPDRDWETRTRCCLRGILNQTSEWGTQRDRSASFRLISLAGRTFVRREITQNVASLLSEPILLLSVTYTAAQQVQARTGGVCCRIEVPLTNNVITLLGMRHNRSCSTAPNQARTMSASYYLPPSVVGTVSTANDQRWQAS
jgi:hypothetical protein